MFFRPIGRSADYVAISYGEFDEPISALDVEAVEKLELEVYDHETSVIVGVVNSFSRGSKSGVIYSSRGILFTYMSEENLPRGDDFS